MVESDQISMKAAKIATENVELKSKLDEAVSEKRIFEEKMQLMETLISEKNNTDDVAVLRLEQNWSRNLRKFGFYNYGHMLSFSY